MTKGKNVNHLIIYQDDNGLVKIYVCFADEDVWITQGQLAEIYDTTQQNIALHIKNIYTDKELTDEATHKKYLLVRQEGSRNVQRNIDHYNLDMIIALGYRVQSQVATRFLLKDYTSISKKALQWMMTDSNKVTIAISENYCSTFGIFGLRSATFISR